MASSDGQFCAHHSDNCERLARIETNQEGLRRDVDAALKNNRALTEQAAKTNAENVINMVEVIREQNKSQAKTIAVLVSVISTVASAAAAIAVNAFK